MIDLIEDDISEMSEDGSNELGGYECLAIYFNYLTLYCSEIRIDLSQIEDQYGAFKESKADGPFWILILNSMRNMVPVLKNSVGF